MISRMQEALRDSGRVLMETGADWVTIRLDSDSDIALLLSLISVAIKANTSQPPGVAHRESAPCQTNSLRASWRRR